MQFSEWDAYEFIDGFLYSADESEFDRTKGTIQELFAIIV